MSEIENNRSIIQLDLNDFLLKTDTVVLTHKEV